MKIEELKLKLVDWLRESMRINDEVSDDWREEDIYSEQYWAPNGWENCGFEEDEAEHIVENDEFFEEAVKEAMKSDVK